MELRKHATILGFAGLIPFLCLPVFILLGSVSYYEGLTFFVQYSAIILSFLGGVIWYDGIVNQRPIWQLYIAMLPSIIGFISLVFLPPRISVFILMISFLVVIMLEYYLVKSPQWYLNLRVRLTAITFGGHLMMIWLTYQ